MWQLFKKFFGTKRKAGRRALRTRLVLEAFEARDLPSAGPGMFAAHGFFLGARSHAEAAAASGNCDDGSHGSQGTNNTQVLTATLTGATGTAGHFTFVSSTTNTGLNTLTLTVSGLTANHTFTIQVGGTTVGTVATNANGRGTASLSNLSSTLTAAITSGAAVTVLDTSTTPSTTVLQGTLATGSSGHEHHAGRRLTAHLTSPTSATGVAGFASFSTTTPSGQNLLRVSVAGLAAGTYTVQVGGTTVGTTLTVDANGRGHLSVNNITVPVTAGTTTVTVLDSTGAPVLQGTLAVGSSADDGAGHHHHHH
jgi:hypothetical protein